MTNFKYKPRRLPVFVFLLAALLSMVGSCKQKPYSQGQILYENFCQNCHNEEGKALRQLIPPLAASDYLVNHKEELACIIKYGIKGEIVVNGVTYNQEMPAFEEMYDAKILDVEIANIINYINNSWGNDNGYTSLQTVQENLKRCEE